MSSACPHCHGTGVQLPANPHVLRADFERACIERGIWVSPDGKVRESDAAGLIGLSPKTLRNWRHADRRLPFTTRAGRPLYALDDLAEFATKA